MYTFLIPSSTCSAHIHMYMCANDIRASCGLLERKHCCICLHTQQSGAHTVQCTMHVHSKTIIQWSTASSCCPLHLGYVDGQRYFKVLLEDSWEVQYFTITLVSFTLEKAL